MPLHLEAIQDALNAADIFAAIGTSDAVYPAAGLSPPLASEAFRPANSTWGRPTMFTCLGKRTTARQPR